MDAQQPAIHASVPPAAAPIDYDRVLRVILALEGRRWDSPGGGLGWQPASWREDTRLPFSYACRPPTALFVARDRLTRFAALATVRGVTWTPRLCFATWRWGFSDGIKRANLRLPLSYEARGSNLYLDPTFR